MGIFQVWDDVKANLGKIQTRFCQSKLAEKFSTFAKSRSYHAFSKTTSSIGFFLLGKTLIQGVLQKDYTSVGIISGRVALDGAAFAGNYAGRVAVFGSKFGKIAGVVGEVAGPVGIAFDMGLSIYSLCKSIERLNSAKNEFDRRDAIIDVVQSTADLAITGGVVVLSIIFPPAAPIIAIAGIILSAVVQFGTSLFKTGNEIDRINSEIPLLGFERREEFLTRFFDWLGTRKKDYIDDNVNTKHLNEIAVKQGIELLEANPQFTGMAIPARSFAYSGTCSAIRRTCWLKNAWGCTKAFDRDVILASGCDPGEMCDGHTCANWWTSTGAGTYDDYRCECDKKKAPTTSVSSYPRLNNIIDFRVKKWLYLERSVPGHVSGAQYKCRPGHESYQGFRVSQKGSSFEYLCEGAIAIYQPRRTEESVNGTFFFNLEDREDKVILDPNSSEGNLFVVQNGVKNFLGTKGPDTFVLHENCTEVSGTLHGGPNGEGNRLILSEKFLQGKIIK